MVGESLKTKLGSTYYKGVLTCQAIGNSGSRTNHHTDFWNELREWWDSDTYKEGMKKLNKKAKETTI